MTRATVFQRDPAAQARAFEAMGFEYLHVVDLDGALVGTALIHTYMYLVGVLVGFTHDAAIALAETVSIPVIVSGGLASIADVAALLQPCAKKLAGAIAGRALYDGRLDPTEALRLIRTARAAT